MNERTRNTLLAAAGCLIACAAILFQPGNALAAPDRPPIAVHAQDATAETQEVDILPADFTPRSRSSGAIRIGVGFATDGVFSIVIKNAAGTVVDELSFFGGDELEAGAAFTFTWPVRPDRKYNFQTTETGNVTLYIDEIQGGKL